jgi:hypothetical protein
MWKKKRGNVRKTRKRKEKENRRRNTLDIPKAEFEKRKNEKGAIYSSFDPFPRTPQKKVHTKHIIMMKIVMSIRWI